MSFCSQWHELTNNCKNPLGVKVCFVSENKKTELKSIIFYSEYTSTITAVNIRDAKPRNPSRLVPCDVSRRQTHRRKVIETNERKVMIIGVGARRYSYLSNSLSNVHWSTEDARPIDRLCHILSQYIYIKTNIVCVR